MAASRNKTDRVFDERVLKLGLLGMGKLSNGGEAAREHGATRASELMDSKPRLVGGTVVFGVLRRRKMHEVFVGVHQLPQCTISPRGINHVLLCCTRPSTPA